jgi:uncharacterized glyoxalase superfamily protein PhnB
MPRTAEDNALAFYTKTLNATQNKLLKWEHREAEAQWNIDMLMNDIATCEQRIKDIEAGNLFAGNQNNNQETE